MAAAADFEPNATAFGFCENSDSDDATETPALITVGFFKTVFDSQYGRTTGPANGNFWATDAKRSLVGGVLL
jgi:hypothetical protein